MSQQDWENDPGADLGDDGDVPEDPLLEGAGGPDDADLGEDEEDLDGVA